MSKYTHEDGVPFTKEEFLEKLETDTEFNDEFGNKGIDQISELINQLKENPDSRRLMVSAWAADDLSNMVLPPCHYGFQVYTRELSFAERCEIQISKLDGIYSNEKNIFIHHLIDEIKLKRMDENNIPTRTISLMWSQRSVDTFLGLPFNIASYALLLEIIAKEVNMVPDELIGNLGDVHLYKNHINQAKMQILRKPYSLPKVQIAERNWYQHEAVKEHMGPKTFEEKLLSYRPECFELIGYESHSGIKAPLSN
jgi:thymidylate synthase